MGSIVLVKCKNKKQTEIKKQQQTNKKTKNPYIEAEYSSKARLMGEKQRQTWPHSDQNISDLCHYFLAQKIKTDDIKYQ